MLRTNVRRAAACLLLATGLALAGAVPGNAISSEPTPCGDVELGYDDGTRYWSTQLDPGWDCAVRFSAGAGTVTQVKAFVEKWPGEAGRLWFDIRTETGGKPGAKLWSSASSVNVEGWDWYVQNCNQAVTGPFYVCIRADSIKAIFHGSDAEVNAPSGTYWKLIFGAWQSWSAYGDFMVRAEFTPASVVTEPPDVPDARGLRLGIAPNPVAGGFATVRVQGASPRVQGLSVRVFDAAGRCVLARSIDNRHPAFELPLDVRSLSSGVYLVRLDTRDGTAAQKLLVQHRDGAK